MSNGSNYDVVVKLSTLCTGDLSASMNTAKGAMQSMASELGNADSGTKKLSATFRGVTEDGNKYTLSMRQLADSHAKYTPLVDQLTGALGKLAGAYLSMESIKVFVGDLEEAVKVGLGQDDQLNVLAIGIADLVNSTKIFTDTQGVALTGTAKFNAALALGNSIVERFHASALTYGLELPAEGDARAPAAPTCNSAAAPAPGRGRTLWAWCARACRGGGGRGRGWAPTRPSPD